MRSIRKFGGAVIIAATMTLGLHTTTVEAKGKASGGDAQAAVCAYLYSIITYPYVSEAILAQVLPLYYDVYRCGG